MNLSVNVMIVVAILGANCWGQELNSATGSLDVNGSSSSGSAPYSVTIEHPQPVIIQVSGAVDQPYVLIGAASVNVGNTVFSGVGQIDIGPTPAVLVDGISGPFFPHFANTGSSGIGTIQISVAQGSVATGTVVQGLQAAVVDPTMGPFNVVLTAATGISFTNNVSVNAQPIADAGVSRFVDGQTCIILDGSASVDPEMSSLNYVWTQTAGTPVTYESGSGATTVMPKFIAPVGPETLVFELVVNDGVNNSAPATVYVPVQATAGTVGLTIDLVPIFTTSCVSCHDATHATLDLTDATTAYAGFFPAMSQALVDPCDVANSIVLQKVVGNLNHAGFNFAPLSAMSTSFTMIETWITEGARNN